MPVTHKVTIHDRTLTDLGLQGEPGAKPRYQSLCSCGWGEMFPYTANDTNAIADACQAANLAGQEHVSNPVIPDWVPLR